MALGAALGDYVSALRGLNRNIRLFLIVPMLLGFTIWGGISAVLTNLYLVRLGYGPDFVGLLNSVQALSMAVFALPAAAISRRFGCRRSMVVGLAICAGGNAAVALAGLLPGEVRDVAMPAAGVLASFGLDLYIVSSGPLLMSLTTPVDRGHAYSLQSAFSPIAAFAGSIVGGMLPSWLLLAIDAGADGTGAYRLALVISASLLALAVFAVAAIHEPAPAVEPKGAGAAGERSGAPWGLIGLVCLVTMLQSAGEGISRTFVNVYLDVGLRLPTPEIGALLSLAQVVAFPAALVTPLLIRRWGGGGVFVRASLGMAFALVALALIASPAGASLGYVGVIALGCMARPCLMMFQYEIVPARWWTTMAGAAVVSFGLSNALTSLGAGYLIVSSGFASVFLAAAGLTAAGAFVFWGASRRVSRHVAAREGG